MVLPQKVGRAPRLKAKTGSVNQRGAETDTGEEHGFGGRETWVQIPASPLTGCVTSGKLLKLPVPQFFAYKMTITTIST